MRYSDRLYVLISLAALAVNGCGGGGGTGPAPVQPAPPPPPPPPPVTLSVGSATILVGGSIPRRAWVGSTLIQPTWRSLNPAIASISSTGVVTGLMAGTATIEATSGQNQGTAEITVADLRFTQLDVNGRHACARAANGTWYCWGGNGTGALGQLSGAVELCPSQRGGCSTTPRAAEGMPAFQKLSVGPGGTTCGLTAQGQVYCWGRDDNQMYFGDPTESCEVYSGADNVPNTFLTCRFTPALINSSIPFVDIVTGDAICGIDADRAAHCWGADADGSGQLGVPATEHCNGIPCLASPGPSIPGLRFSQLSSGSGTSCGVTESKVGYCWGANGSGRRGAEVEGGPTPNVISGSYEFVGVWNFRDHTCGVTVGGDGYCWGLNNAGQLGQPTTAMSATATPQRIPGSLKFVSLSPGLNFTCGLTVEGTAYCWGDNPSGQLGDGTTSRRSSPAPVSGGHRFTQLASGRQTVCGLTPEGRVYCWGDNRFGGLGNGDSGTELFGNYFSTIPVSVGGLH